MTTLYGIANCDAIKKARKWLNENDIEYTFHDYKKQGVPEKELRNWVEKLGWEILLNKRSTTWRKLPDKAKKSIDKTSAIQIMLDNPSIIKRPVLIYNTKINVGFKLNDYIETFNLN